jgi:hypothetical protein
MAHLDHIHHNAYQHYQKQTAGQVDYKNIREQILWKLVVVTALSYLIWSDKISIVLGDPSEPIAVQSAIPAARAASMGFSLTGPQKDRPGTEIKLAMPKGSFNNVTCAIDPGFTNRNGIASREADTRLSKCRTYIARFAPIAVAEMQRTGIPASITLAQGLLESNAGEAKLAHMTNNHFGMKCFSHRCKKGHCVNFTDNSHKDFFLKYPNAASSFRAHSEFLRNSGRYVHLFELDGANYRGWARGLAEAGYASDQKYGDKLIALIQVLGLDRYDRGAGEINYP